MENYCNCGVAFVYSVKRDNMLKIFINVLIAVLTLVTALALASCGPVDSQAPRQEGVKREMPKQELPEQAIPEDILYSIIKSTTLKNIKRSVDVRLTEKVSEDTLRLIAQRIKTKDSIRYDRTFISYILPNMEVGSGAWATTHYNPQLEVRILGLSKAEEEKRDKEPKDLSRDIIGVWYDERPYAGAKLTLYKKTGKLLIETIYKDGSKSEEQLIEKKSGSSRRFDSVKKSGFGEYWMLDTDGKLKLYDNDGYILTYVSGSK